jgi:mRNA-decapping enzyme subunit 2
MASTPERSSSAPALHHHATPISLDGNSTVDLHPLQYDDIDAIHQAYQDALDDVHARFLLNLPHEELATTDRIFFQLEQAWWFYEDFICDQSELNLPRFKNLKPFAIKMFEISPILQPLSSQFQKMWEEFGQYKRNISTFGTILLNVDCTKLVLCQVWNGKAWTFPAGKVNQNESGTEAGARETYEETGFDPNCQLGLAKLMKDAANAQGENLPWTSLKEDDALVFMDAGKRRTCYVCKGVPDDFPFEPVARKEISAVKWHELDNLPKPSYAVIPFMTQLRNWIRKNSNKSRKKNRGDTPNRKTSTPKNPRSRNSSRGKVRDENDPLAASGLAQVGDESGWSEEEMFKANEKLIGRKVEYDGNPHLFAEQGFQGIDPHAFRVVGGSFMNSGGITKLAPAPDQSRLQPLFRSQAVDDVERDLQPFFSDSGEAPWGSLADDFNTAVEGVPLSLNDTTPVNQETAEDAGQALLSFLRDSHRTTTPDALDIISSKSAIPTDSEITARSQSLKIEGMAIEGDDYDENQNQMKVLAMRERCATATNWIREWVINLERPEPTKLFGEFHFDVADLMESMRRT